VQEPTVDSIQAILIETPKWSFVKRNELGKIDYVSPVPSPFDYGRLEGFTGGDGDPMDAIWLGTRLNSERAMGHVVGVVRFVDGGETDDKWLLSDKKTVSQFDFQMLKVFFRVYAQVKNVLDLFGDRAIISELKAIEIWVDIA
jgi:inorganic pyrophosphatase